jgi:hypothetical protein
MFATLVTTAAVTTPQPRTDSTLLRRMHPPTRQSFKFCRHDAATALSPGLPAVLAASTANGDRRTSQRPRTRTAANGGDGGCSGTVLIIPGFLSGASKYEGMAAELMSLALFDAVEVIPLNP